VELWLHAFLTSALYGGEWSASCLSYFTPGEKSLRYPSDRTLSGLQSWSGCGGGEKKSQPLLRIESWTSSLQPATSLTERGPMGTDILLNGELHNVHASSNIF